MPQPVQNLGLQDRFPARVSSLAGGGTLLFSAALIFFIAALVLWGGLFFYRRWLDGVRQEWVNQLEAREGGLKDIESAELIEVADSIAAAREILANHPSTLNVFRFLEAGTHPKVQFTNFAFALDSRKIDISGLAASYRAVSEQMSILEAHPQVESVEFGGLALGEKGLVDFRLAVTIRPELLRYQP